MAIMNIQIFGKKKCNDTKKAQRYFKERGIKFQFIDMNEKEISCMKTFLSCRNYWMITGKILLQK